MVHLGCSFYSVTNPVDGFVGYVILEDTTLHLKNQYIILDGQLVSAKTTKEILPHYKRIGKISDTFSLDDYLYMGNVSAGAIDRLLMNLDLSDTNFRITSDLGKKVACVFDSDGKPEAFLLIE